jgi:hypothetical protein
VYCWLVSLSLPIGFSFFFVRSSPFSSNKEIASKG